MSMNLLKTIALSTTLGFMPVAKSQAQNVEKCAVKNAKTCVAKFAPQPQADVFVDAGVMAVKDIPSPAFRLHGKVEKNNGALDLTGIYSTKSSGKNAIALGDAAFTKIFPLDGGFDATATLGATGALKYQKNGDNHGVIAPYLKAGFRYAKEFANKIRLAAKAELGGAQEFFVKRNSDQSKTKTDFIVNGELEGAYKNAGVFVNGGKSPVVGANIGGGFRFNF